jgi:hypothetical protein
MKTYMTVSRNIMSRPKHLHNIQRGKTYMYNFIQCSILPRTVEGIYKEYIQTSYTSQIDKNIVTMYESE